MLDFGALVLWMGSHVSLSFIAWLVFLILWRINISTKVRFFTRQVLHGCANTLDRLVRKKLSLVGPFCHILCWKAEENLD